MKCEECIYFRPQETTTISQVVPIKPGEITRARTAYQGHGRCHRFPPTHEGWPKVLGHELCGEFEKRVRRDTKVDDTPYSEVVGLYHECLPENPQVAKLTDKRKAAIRRSMKDLPTLDHWKGYFLYCAKSQFLTGKTCPRPGSKVFIADIDFLLREGTMVAVKEGKYHGS